MRKKTKIILILVILLFIGTGIYRYLQRSPEIVPLQIESSFMPVEISLVRKGYIEGTNIFTGIIKGEEETIVYPEVMGKLLYYTVKEGEYVRKNDTIALLDRSQPGLEYEPAKVRAPLEGIVARTYLDIGNVASPQVPVALIVKMDKVKIQLNISEKDIFKIKIGQIAKVWVDTYPQEIFTGEITRISSIIDPLTGMALAEVTLDNPGHLLKPGMFAKVEVIIEKKDNVVIIDKSAILKDLEKGIDYVFVVNSQNEAEKRNLILGLEGEEEVEVISGLKENERLVINGQNYLVDGEKVKIVGENQ